MLIKAGQCDLPARDPRRAKDLDMRITKGAAREYSTHTSRDTWRAYRVEAPEKRETQAEAAHKYLARALGGHFAHSAHKYFAPAGPGMLSARRAKILNVSRAGVLSARSARCT